MEETAKRVSVSVNGTSLEAREGERLIDVLLENGTPIPHVCYLPILGPIQTCDTCIVSVDGAYVRACAETVRDGMSVDTESRPVKAREEEAMQRILGNHRLYCTVCDNNNGDCVVHNTTELLRIEHQTIPYTPKPYPPIDDSNPFYRYDVNQCILCGRCVEACQDLEVNETLSIDWSLERPRVVWDDHKPIGESSCVSCGHCVTVCPCNALMEKSMLGEAGFLTGIKPDTLLPMIDLVEGIEPSMGPVFALSNVESQMRDSRIKRTKTVCTYCGVGCSFNVWTRDRKILQIEPPLEAPVNSVSTCVKGKFGWDWVNSPERLTKPLIRDGDGFREAAWDEALNLVASRLSAIKKQDGPNALMFVASSKGSNEEAYLVQKLARSVIGTNNVDNDSTYCQDPATFGLKATAGYGADSGTLKDIEAADLVIAIGSNTAESHPVFATRVKRAHKLRGQKLVVIDVRRHEMADRADLYIHPKSGSDPYLLAGVQKYLVDQGWIDREFLNQHVNGVDEYLKSLEPYTLDQVEALTGVTPDTIKTLAEMIHQAPKVAILWAMGITQQGQGAQGSLAIANLLLLTGNIGRPGTGGYPLRGHNNVQGASDFGSKPRFLPGYQDVRDEKVRAHCESVWGGEPIPDEPGLSNTEIADGVLDGRIKGLYIVGEDTALVDNNISRIQKALEKVDFLVVQEVFMTKTAQYADVILPAVPSLEKEGTFVNTERRIQRFYQALDPLGDAKPDWVILTEVANRLGVPWHYSHPSEIMAEVSRVAPLFAGVSYERLEGFQSLNWPVAADGTDQPLLYQHGFNHPDGKAKLVPLSFHEVPVPETEYDILVNNGQLLEHFHEGNLTYRVPGIKHLVPHVFVEVSPELAREKNLKDGQWVRLITPDGRARMRVVITERVEGHEVYLPMNSTGDGAINQLTPEVFDPETRTPGYKHTYAKLEPLDVEPGTPLPRRNWRYQKRNPQPGVRVEKKWERGDYRPLVTVNAEERPVEM
ncbi:formate dehydrogenase subunit alpha [Sulfobacillus harzensis]|uniref:Formate dehydrogenase subunit alpha n=1 Tax=Sulfobacillus harzensis TaxID=2729629 RepID=A0A7Y0Q651_9FIRM|nr:formate dehydrogenase subunit alpha [Sulfobacillus harzensis]NMP24979.1 formate dehydrogenase subunit alpha [Sulfobacillus harzensis]